MSQKGTAVIGCGYWGPNIIRNLYGISNLKYVVDIDLDRARNARAKFNGVIPTNNIEVVLNDLEVEAIAIVTPPNTHMELTEKVLNSQKHVFVEKPLAHNLEDAEKMVELASNFPYSCCCVGHVFLFAPEVIKLKSLIDKGTIGKIRHINTYRFNFGKYQRSGIELDLLPHDISIMSFLTGRTPLGISKVCCNIDGFNSVASALFSFTDSDIQAMANISWEHTERVRKVTVIGESGTLEYDMSVPHFIKYFENRRIESNETGNLKFIEVEDHSEPLLSELQYWFDLMDKPNLKNNKISFEHGLNVVKAIHSIMEKK